MEKQPNEPEDFTNEPLPSMTEPMEVQDAVASTLATPFLQPIIATFKSKAQKQREYRQRIAASRTPAQAAAARKSKNERQRKNRLRQAANLAIANGSLEATTTSSTSSSHSGEESNNVQIRSQRQHAQQQSVTPFAKPITAAAKTRAQIQREYRQRIAASKTPAQAAAAREARNLRERNNRLRRAANLAIASGSLEATTTSTSRSRQRLNTVHIDTQRQFTNQQRQTLVTEPAETTVQPSTSSDQIEVQAQSTWNTKWASSIMRFKSTFLDDYGYACSVCDRLWFRNDLKPITAAQLKWHTLSVEQRAEYYDQACEEQRRYALLHPYRLCRCPKRKPGRDDINFEKCRQKDNTELGNQETEPRLKREASPVDIEYNRYVSQQYEFTKFAFELNAKEDDAKSCFERNVRQDTKLNDNGKEIKIEPCEMNNEIEDFVPHTVKLEIIEYEETKIGGIASQAAAVEMIKVENIKEENIEL